MPRMVVVILLGVCLGVALIELGLGFFTTGRVVTLPHSKYLLSRIPNSKGKWISPRREFHQVIQFNSLGLRGSEPDLLQPHRILVLGDSMVEALQVTEEETFCHQIQEGLGEEFAVVNAGVGGYSPLLMCLRLPELMEQIHPQTVLVCLFPNDLEEEHRYWDLAEPRENSFPLSVAAPILKTRRGRVESALFQWSALWRFLHPPQLLTPPEELSGRQGEPPEGVIFPFRSHWTELEDKAWSQISRSLGEIDRICRTHRARISLVLIPPGTQVSPDAWKTGKQTMGFGPEEWVTTTPFQDEAKTRAQRIGIPVTDLLAPFRAHPNPAKLFFDWDGHWTREGHQLAAHVLLNDSSMEWLAP